MGGGKVPNKFKSKELYLDITENLISSSGGLKFTFCIKEQNP